MHDEHKDPIYLLNVNEQNGELLLTTNSEKATQLPVCPMEQYRNRATSSTEVFKPKRFRNLPT